MRACMVQDDRVGTPDSVQPRTRMVKELVWESVMIYLMVSEYTKEQTH